ncbi:ubiquitin-conjugating enzyme/RWD-like protein [Lineolata rhizophorae]|uniref:Ubiquitin-conjugating enzyme/RWD-like protein n=1 Tax=Lineolata rhizophorae TaxID=578093 RepID=A0A6A6P9W7_9PEZI|nr:ubiquitin-conjugating enzyme/RWD-like protein [Lineolata rhizophorae]
MNSRTLRRLAADHASLHYRGLPPNYLFPLSNTNDGNSIIGASTDDLSHLTVLLAGPESTPYSAGVFSLHLKMPSNYPQGPPTATFQTRIWHPNVDESTGAVCVDTLKRDWNPKLTLRDVLVTISCLLIQPNPASALNEMAGKLCQEDWDAFESRAKLMVDVHAGIPAVLRSNVEEAKRRGDEAVELRHATDASKGKAKANMSSGIPESSKMYSEHMEDGENIAGNGRPGQNMSQSRENGQSRDAVVASTLPNALGIQTSGSVIDSLSEQSGIGSNSIPTDAATSASSISPPKTPDSKRAAAARSLVKITTPSGARSVPVVELPWLLDAWAVVCPTPNKHKERVEKKKMRAAKGNLNNWNRGLFGVRKDLGRL